MSSINKLASLAVATILVAACSGCVGGADESSEEDSWVGTITTEGTVTTVVNESGSVWGATATLVEEASIGVESGADEYMFGELSAVHVDGERIYVVDRQAPIVRMYDYDGNHLGDLGGPGEGPGEYGFPAFIATAPDGRGFLVNGRALNVYAATGESIGRWETGFNNCCLYPMGVDGDGVPWLATGEIGADRRIGRDGVQAVGPDGRVGEPRWVPESAITPADLPIPFLPAFAWTITPAGEIVAGDSNDYRFQVERHDGTSLVVESSWEPVAMKAGEKEYWTRLLGMMMSAGGQAEPPDLQLPDTKAAFFNFIGSQTGEIWVLRYAEGVEITDCIDPASGQPPMSPRDFCWPPTLIADVFDADGRFLGDVSLPGDTPWLEYTRTSIRGDTVVTTFEDDAGTIMVKRYRLALPSVGGSE